MSMFNGTESDLPSGLSKPALRALHGAGYTQIHQISMLTESELLQLHGMGPKGLMYYGVRSLKRGYPLPASPKEQINLKSGKLRIILGLPLFRL